MSQSRRHWPKALMDDIWIALPHAVLRLIQRAGLGGMSVGDGETLLRQLVATEIDGGHLLENSGRFNTQKGEKLVLVKIEPPGHKVCYPLIERGKPGGRFGWLVRTVFSREQYESFNTDGKLGTWQDLDEQKVKIVDDSEARKEQEVERENGFPECYDCEKPWEECECKERPSRKIIEPGESPLLLVCKTGEILYCAAGELQEKVLGLLLKGHPLTSITVYLKQELDFRVVLK